MPIPAPSTTRKNFTPSSRQRILRNRKFMVALLWRIGTARGKSRKKSKTTSKSPSGAFHHPILNPGAAFSQARRVKKGENGPNLISGVVKAGKGVVLPFFIGNGP